jgi:hypothetical protein
MKSESWKQFDKTVRGFIYNIPQDENAETVAYFFYLWFI